MTVLALVSGGAVGFTLGLIGGGGSILATPLLLYVVGVRDPHMAIGTSAVAVAVNAYANLAGHALRGNVRWCCGAVFAAVGVAGALLGSLIGKAVDGQSLLFLFGLLMLAVAALMLRPRGQEAEQELPADRSTCLRTAGVATLAGGASGFFGIGGGFLIVPALMAATRMPMIKAVGTSLLSVGTFGLATALSYAWSGLVDWPVALNFIAGGVLGGLAGMALATKLSAGKTLLNRLFAAIVAVVALYVLYRSGSVLFT
ncbi:sulfite exporter TauE/SafE family protein [Rhizobium sp. TRM95796]|uniref:sulfite exporter TauE/SafE family protein n=1 Tax=Rhizobium sp. TRM95796 TaxID=2979862 RepID=UPI0021E84C3E|nr:sulfite exporter TauE/SafE family protein [Rhizobium sp. TRM95796]MCV3766511.1 sulfite exporter TauE/SafE family protein [Rhizobium sp. TRM95796]